MELLDALSETFDHTAKIVGGVDSWTTPRRARNGRRGSCCPM